MSSPARTWAKVVEQAHTAPTEKKLFARSECTVSLAKYLPLIKTPTPSGKYPVFFDLSSTKASHEEIAQALPPGILGLHWRADMNILEVDVQTEEEQSDLLSTPLQIINQLALPPIPSSANLPRFVLVKLANVPIASAVSLETILRRHWEQFGKVREIAPHRIPGKAWLTRRWDLVLEIDPSNTEAPTTIFEVLGVKVLAWWPRAPKTCLTCKIVGHDSSSCPRKKSKKSGSTDPPKPPSTNPPKAPTTSVAGSTTAPVSEESKSGRRRRRKKNQSEEDRSAGTEMQGVVEQDSSPQHAESSTSVPPQSLPPSNTTATTPPPINITHSVSSPMASSKPFPGSVAVTSGSSTVYTTAPVYGPPPPPADEDEFEMDGEGNPILSSPDELRRYMARSGTPTPALQTSPAARHTPPTPAEGSKKKKKRP